MAKIPAANMSMYVRLNISLLDVVNFIPPILQLDVVHFLICNLIDLDAHLNCSCMPYLFYFKRQIL